VIESTTEQSVTTVDNVRAAQAAAEQQLADVRSQMRSIEAEIRQLNFNGGLTDEQREQERARLRGGYPALAAQEQATVVWLSQLRNTIEQYELRVSRPHADLRQAATTLGAIDERLVALVKHMRALEGDREVALLHVATAQAAVDAVEIQMPERLHYPTPRAVYQPGEPTLWLDAAGVEVQQDGSPRPS
jgi:hypothetical protein